ncbi:hypothetical protein [Tunturiibacter lichenicola]|uniref:hypothetical protein n=1 Tax=Tunturiibacter lichenicola TaxID=2051959 RepID=UPI003D9BCDEF
MSSRIIADALIDWQRLEKSQLPEWRANNGKPEIDPPPNSSFTLSDEGVDVYFVRLSGLPKLSRST